MKIQIAHLYPELLNLYGDRGNIASLCYRLQKRGIECRVREYAPADEIDFENTDIFYIGGGTDKDQRTVCEILVKYKDKFRSYVENGGTLLAVCGGFELMGKYYMSDGEKVPALDILDMYTENDSERHIGNVVIKSDIIGTEIVGFENHSGIVHINGAEPLGKIVAGFGNDGKSGLEGAVHKNLVASYLHGPLLPKNPKLCDCILLKAIEHKYGKYELAPMDDTLENAAHEYAVKRFSQKNLKNS